MSFALLMSEVASSCILQIQCVIEKTIETENESGLEEGDNETDPDSNEETKTIWTTKAKASTASRRFLQDFLDSLKA